MCSASTTGRSRTTAQDGDGRGRRRRVWGSSRNGIREIGRTGEGAESTSPEYSVQGLSGQGLLGPPSPVHCSRRSAIDARLSSGSRTTSPPGRCQVEHAAKRSANEATPAPASIHRGVNVHERKTGRLPSREEVHARDVRVPSSCCVSPVACRLARMTARAAAPGWADAAPEAVRTVNKQRTTLPSGCHFTHSLVAAPLLLSRRRSFAAPRP